MLEAILEIALSLVGELFLDLGWVATSQALRTKRRRRTVLGVFGWFALGLGLGALSVWIHPAHFVHRAKFRLAILVGAPIVAGLAMRAYGRSARRRGKTPSSLATFTGGAVFAFGMHLVRYLWH
jgi:hypothetical protein